MADPTLPATMKALVVPSPGQPLALQTVPTPTPTPGSCVVKILAVEADAQTPLIVAGQLPGYVFPAGFTPGAHAVGRVVAPGPDATAALSVGQLVLLEGFVRARDDPDGIQFLWGISAAPEPDSLRLMADNWSAACLAEYVRAPLENCHPLNESRLCGSGPHGLGYTPSDLIQLATQLVSMGGLRAIDVRPGERVLVAPSTGRFSGAAVQVALALGAAVVAVGRDRAALEGVRRLLGGTSTSTSSDAAAAGVRGRGVIEIVQVTGDAEADAAALRQWGPVDAYVDLSPPGAGESTHFRSCFAALRKCGRACVMNVVDRDVAVPFPLLTWNSLTVKGKFMYEREDVRLLIQMAETGVLKLGKEGGNEVVGTFKLEEFEQAFEVAAKSPGVGKIVAIVP